MSGLPDQIGVGEREVGNLPMQLADYLSVLERRKWVVLIAVLAVALAAGIYSMRQPGRYEASADVLLNQGNIATAITKVSAPIDPTLQSWLAETQAAIARSPVLARQVVETADVERTGGELLANSRVSLGGNVLTFSVVDESPAVATQLATTYAGKYPTFLKEINTKPTREALRNLQAKSDLRRVSPLYAHVADAQTMLKLAGSLAAANAVLLRPAYGADKIAPRPKRVLVLGAATGLVLGLILAFVIEALDNRVRSEREIEELLGAPLLGRIPPPSRDGEVAMATDPESETAEAVRQVRIRLELANLEAQARTIVVTSAVEGEGKSTTAANLAIALARAGRRVVIVDFDLRRPSLLQFFGARTRPGLTDVITGSAKLDQALRGVPIDEHRRNSDFGTAAGNGFRLAQPSPPENSSLSWDEFQTPRGSLEILPVGPIPSDPGEFVAEPALGRVLTTLREQADAVLIDAPPMLSVGDVTALSAHADALLVVVRLGHTQRAQLVDLARELRNCPARNLGFVATGAAFEDGLTPPRRSGYRGAARPGAPHGATGSRERSAV
jgi:Mrp family chromosome partitioning ATPase